MATFLGVDEPYIWPGALGKDEVAAMSQSGVMAMWPHRWAVPRDTWRHFFAKAEREIGTLVYSGMFMAEDIGVHKLAIGHRIRNDCAGSSSLIRRCSHRGDMPAS